jgi:hypothetical protein
LTLAVQRNTGTAAVASESSAAEAEFRERLAALEARTAGVPFSSPAVDAKPRTVQTLQPEEESSPFECNICLELAREPVVTYCGHLYCWPCLYRCRSLSVARPQITIPIFPARFYLNFVLLKSNAGLLASSGGFR